MDKTILLMAIATALALILAPFSAEAKGKSKASTPLTPAPAPAPDYVNLTHLLTVAGPFSTFLFYLKSTKVIYTFQNQANTSEQGVTIFAPTDSAFNSLKSPSLKNLTSDQLKSLCLFHGLPRYYSLAEFTTLSQQSPVSTLAGREYTLNFTDVSGAGRISSGWSNTKISSSVISTSPVAVYQIDKVLLPEAIFGTDIPPTPAPAPAHVASPVADSPVDATSANPPSSSASSSSSQSTSAASTTMSVSSSIWGLLILLVVLGGLGLLL